MLPRPETMTEAELSEALAVIHDSRKQREAESRRSPLIAYVYDLRLQARLIDEAGRRAGACI